MILKRYSLIWYFIMSEWNTENFDRINWNTMHIIIFDDKGMKSWEELKRKRFNLSGYYDIKYNHAFESDNKQTYTYLNSKGWARTGSEAKEEVCQGLYNGLINGNTKYYSSITLELFYSQPSIKKVFFDLVFYND